MNQLASRLAAISLAAVALFSLTAPALAVNEAQIVTGTPLDVDSNGRQVVNQGVAAATSSAWPVFEGGYSYAYETFTGSATQSAKASAGVVHTMVVTTPAAGAVVKLFDGTDQSVTANDTLIGTFDASATGSVYLLDAAFNKGLLVVDSAASPDIVVSKQ